MGNATQHRRRVGLIKFFKNEDFLDQFLSGCFYCNTPEYYRLSNSPGVSDKNESALYTYRQSRGDSGIKLSINDLVTDEVLSLTIHPSGFGDAYLHCWTLFEIPKTESDLNLLKNDLKRMRSEFGEHYAFLPLNNLSELFGRINKRNDKKVWCQEVTYSASPNRWSSVCKSKDFAYQREFRFGIEGCNTHSLEPLILQCPNGFKDLVHKNPHIELGDQMSGVKWLEIHPMVPFHV